VREAIKLSIPLVALVDTDANPEEIDYPIPGNDDAIRSVRFIVSSLVEAVDEGLQNYHAIKKEGQETGQEAQASASEESGKDKKQEEKNDLGSLTENQEQPEKEKKDKEEEKKGEKSEIRNSKFETEKEEAKEKKE
jgi:small subunit ribosomal protein S2